VASGAPDFQGPEDVALGPGDLGAPPERAGRYRLPDALRRADTIARAGPPPATMTGRQSG
jgi:hypothetical protein